MNYRTRTFTSSGTILVGFSLSGLICSVPIRSTINWLMLFSDRRAIRGRCGRVRLGDEADSNLYIIIDTLMRESGMGLETKEIRILPPNVLGRFGSSPEPMDNFSLAPPGDAPSGPRAITPAPTLQVDRATGRVVGEVTPA